MGKCVGVRGEIRRNVGCVKKCGLELWESVWGECGGCGKVCWGVGEMKKDVGGWREVRGDVGCVKKCDGRCGRVYGVSVEGGRKRVGVR